MYVYVSVYIYRERDSIKIHTYISCFKNKGIFLYPKFLYLLFHLALGLRNRVYYSILSHSLVSDSVIDPINKKY